MRMGWHILIPLGLINVVDVGIALALSSEFGLNRWAAMIITTAVTLVAAIFLLHWNDKYSAALLADSSAVEDPHAG
jgi:NADH:ubiquinone oxidoreductase subunit H